jgi:hypothetical protein
VLQSLLKKQDHVIKINIDNDNSSSSNNMNKGKGTSNKEKLSNTEAILIECNTNLRDSRFLPTPGKMFRVKCPTCLHVNAMVFGTEIYHPLSSICKAASHSGYLPKGKKGTVVVEVLGAARAFNGSPGLDSSMSGSFGASQLSFILKRAPKILKLSCSSRANENEIGIAPLFKKFVVKCPKHCSTSTANVFGNKVYSDDSAICVAAIHYGMTSDLGGEVIIVLF